MLDSYSLHSALCFILYSLAFSVTIPMGGTPGIMHEASKEIVLYTFALLVFIILCTLQHA